MAYLIKDETKLGDFAYIMMGIDFRFKVILIVWNAGSELAR